MSDKGGEGSVERFYQVFPFFLVFFFFFGLLWLLWLVWSPDPACPVLANFRVELFCKMFLAKISTSVQLQTGITGGKCK